MGESTEGKRQSPGFAMVPIKVKTHSRNQDKKKERMAKYSAIAECLTKEEKPNRLINYVRQKGTDEEKPCV
jgi:signal recognition particle GTPase